MKANKNKKINLLILSFLFQILTKSKYKKIEIYFITKFS